jgi:hypothetical protein
MENIVDLSFRRYSIIHSPREMVLVLSRSIEPIVVTKLNLKEAETW